MSMAGRPRSDPRRSMEQQSVSATLDSLLQKGALGLLFLIFLGLGFLVWKAGPRAGAFLTGLVEEQKLTRDALAALREILLLEIKEIRKGQEVVFERVKAELASSASGMRAAVREQADRTGQHAAQTAEAAAALAVARVSGVDLDELASRRPSPPNPIRGYRPALPPPTPTQRSSVILIVEDDPDNAYSLRVLLRAKLRIEATVAHSSREAHELLRPPARLPKVAIIDYHLGHNESGEEETGVDLARQLPRTIAIILVSGAIDREALGRRAAGLHAMWFEKPITDERATSLVAEVKRLLDETSDVD